MRASRASVRPAVMRDRMDVWWKEVKGAEGSKHHWLRSACGFPRPAC